MAPRQGAQPQTAGVGGCRHVEAGIRENYGRNRAANALAQAGAACAVSWWSSLPVSAAPAGRVPGPGCVGGRRGQGGNAAGPCRHSELRAASVAMHPLRQARPQQTGGHNCGALSGQAGTGASRALCATRKHFSLSRCLCTSTRSPLPRREDCRCVPDPAAAAPRPYYSTPPSGWPSNGSPNSRYSPSTSKLL